VATRLVSVEQSLFGFLLTTSVASSGPQGQTILDAAVDFGLQTSCPEHAAVAMAWLGKIAPLPRTDPFSAFSKPGSCQYVLAASFVRFELQTGLILTPEAPDPPSSRWLKGRDSRLSVFHLSVCQMLMIASIAMQAAS
jgi:hypothetical protein